MDTHLFLLINHDLQNSFFDVAMPFITNKGYILLLAVTVPLFLKNWRKGLLVFTLCILGYIIANNSADILKHLFERPRPYKEIENVRLLVASSRSFSFPSGHAATSFAMASIIGHYYRRAALLSFTLAGLVAFSRIYVGVHYPSDVIGGAVCGSIVGWAIIFIHKRITEHHCKKTA